MTFVVAGDALEANRQLTSQMQAFAEMLLNLAQLVSSQSQPEADESGIDQDTDATESADLTEPNLGDQFIGQLETESIHGAVERLGSSREDGLVYQAEAFAVFRQGGPTGTTYQVASPVGEPLMVFEQVGQDVHLIADNLPPELKQDLLSAADRLQTQDLAVVLQGSDPKALLSTLGEAAPGGTRAAWVTQQMLKERDTFTPDQGNFQFDRDPRGNLSVTDRTTRQTLLQVAPTGQITCTLNAEQLDQFRSAFDRLTTYESSRSAARTASAAAAQTGRS